MSISLFFFTCIIILVTNSTKQKFTIYLSWTYKIFQDTKSKCNMKRGNNLSLFLLSLARHEHTLLGPSKMPDPFRKNSTVQRATSVSLINYFNTCFHKNLCTSTDIYNLIVLKYSIWILSLKWPSWLCSYMGFL